MSSWPISLMTITRTMYVAPVGDSMRLAAVLRTCSGSRLQRRSSSSIRGCASATDGLKRASAGIGVGRVACFGCFEKFSKHSSVELFPEYSLCSGPEDESGLTQGEKLCPNWRKVPS